MQTSPRTDDVANVRSELDARFRGPLMSFFLRRVKDRLEAQDLTQEVLTRVIGAAEFERLNHTDAFVFRVAVNLLKDRRRSAMRSGVTFRVPIDEALSNELELQLREDLTPERVLLGKDSLADVLRTLGELGERTRDIFILFRLENMKQRDIAALYGIGQSTVEKHVMKAVMYLASKYGQIGS